MFYHQEFIADQYLNLTKFKFNFQTNLWLTVPDSEILVAPSNIFLASLGFTFLSVGSRWSPLHCIIHFASKVTPYNLPTSTNHGQSSTSVKSDYFQYYRVRHICRLVSTCMYVWIKCLSYMCLWSGNSLDSIWRAGKLGRSELGVGTMHVLAFGYSVATSGKQIRKDNWTYSLFTCSTSQLTQLRFS